jgi:prevent-host-death family protein
LSEIVIAATLMTMSRRAQRWSIAAAKAGLSKLVDDAQEEPQVLERRGKPIAVVLAIGEYEDRGATSRWRQFLDASAVVRREGGGKLRVPRRQRRASPFERA